MTGKLSPSKKRAIIIVGILGGLLLLVPALLVLGFIIFSFANVNKTVDESMVTRQIQSIDGVADVEVNFGHSGAPWNNNLTITIQNEDNDPVQLAESIAQSKSIILEATKDMSRISLRINFSEEINGRYQNISQERYRATCALLFAPSDEVICNRYIILSKEQLQNL